VIENRHVAFLMPMGPGEAEIVIDNITSISLFYPSAHLVILDDCTSDGTYERVRDYSKGHNVLLLRNERPAGWVMLINTIAFGISEILSRIPNVDFLIKIDADCAIVGPGLIEAFSSSYNKCGSGMVGQYKVRDEGKPPHWAHMKKKMIMDMLPIGLAKTSRSGNRWNQIRIGWPPYISYYAAAKKSNYSLAENIFGPCYAIHSTTLHKMRSSGFLQAVRHPFKCAMCEEDLLVSLGVKSVGDDLHDISDLGFPKLLKLWCTTKPNLSPDELVASGAAVAHSLKHWRPEMVEYRNKLIELRNQSKSPAIGHIPAATRPVSSIPPC
jgi:hypothetical protein